MFTYNTLQKRAISMFVLLPALIVLVAIAYTAGMATASAGTKAPAEQAKPAAASAPASLCNSFPNYLDYSSFSYIRAGTVDIGNHCDDCNTAVTLPFAFTLYDQSFSTANISSNGNMQFSSNSTDFINQCLPYATFSNAIFTYWDDLDTEVTHAHCPSAGCGIFTLVEGTAPNRIFNIEWRASFVGGSGVTVRFEVRLYEGTNYFEIVYEDTQSDNGAHATIGVQHSTGNHFTQYESNIIRTAMPNTRISFTLNCPPTSGTPTVVPTQTPPPTATPAVTNTPTVCPIQFEDVPPTSPFYAYIRCLTCRGVIGGYPCGGNNPSTGQPEPCDAQVNPYFRPVNQITRGQISKLVSNSAGFAEDPGGQIFEDVRSDSPFYAFVNRLSNRGVMGGYACNIAPAGPCVAPLNRPYFLPQNNASRGQLTKIVSNAAGFSDPHTEQTFQDVPTSSTFYIFIQRLSSRGAIAGYPCGGSNPESGNPEPCLPPGNLPYFRPGNLVTRGQAAKLVATSFFPGCQAPAR